MRNIITGIFMLCAIAPIGALADYDPVVIKQKIDSAKDTFEVVSWQEADVKGVWLAKSNVQGMVLSVAADATGIIANIEDSYQGAIAMLRCVTLGTIGLSPESEVEKTAIVDTVQQAATNLIQATHMLNGVIFTVEPMQVGNLVILSCLIKPEKT